ncbi:hypothetical protein AMTRI_Chr06g172190 [Amborella trichopoda]
MSYAFSSGRAAYAFFPSDRDCMVSIYAKPTLSSLDFYGGGRGMGKCGKKKGLSQPSLRRARKRRPQNSVQYNSPMTTTWFGGPQDILNGVVEFVERLVLIRLLFMFH